MNIPTLHKVLENPNLPVDPKAAVPVLQRLLTEYAQKLNQLMDWAGTVKVSADDKTPEWLANTLLTPGGTTYETQNSATPNLIVGAAADERVTMNPGLCSANDTTVGFLEDKLSAGANITLLTTPEGGNEKVRITAATGGSGSILHLFAAGNERVSLSIIGSLPSGTYDLNPLTDFNFTESETIQALLLSWTATINWIDGYARLLDFIGAPGFTHAALKIHAETWEVLVPTMEEPGHVKTYEQTGAGVCPVSGGMYRVVVDPASTSTGTLALYCLGYYTGAEWET